eukprot:TRINITY_DN1752_c0_g1_i8.p1 TRINITY_DN1752_c0_g1~~TRINITY_DN1752_c0_g1_i8.p1  ORF type:complete len:181 (+),score=17.50 TRINITY_DN1752_c0_g1_i8:78-620(+)
MEAGLNQWIDVDVCGIKLPARIVLWIVFFLDLIFVEYLAYVQQSQGTLPFATAFVGGVYVLFAFALCNVRGSASVLKLYGKIKYGFAALLVLLGIYCIIIGLVTPSIYFILTILVGLFVFGLGYFIYWEALIWNRALKAIIGQESNVGVPLGKNDQLQQPYIILVQAPGATPNMGVAFQA